MKRKICVVTGSRAEYGLLYWLMKGIQKTASLELQILVTGMHLSPEFGLTYREIENDGFKINKKVEMILSADTPVAIAKSTGLGMISMADSLVELHPDIMVVLGDRYEILSASMAATFLRIPIAHFHGGEATEGLIDEPIRHSITKMAHLHFVAAKDYKKRVIQLGENPAQVYLVGGLGVDCIKNLFLLKRDELEKQLGFHFGKRNLLITFHPVTLEAASAGNQFLQLLEALNSFPELNLLFSKPNADTEGRVIIDLIDEYVSQNQARAKAFHSLGQVRYLSALQFVDAVIGNSSSGLLEVPTFRKGTINIGDRQRGRLRAVSIIDCSPKKESIQKAIQKIYSPEFQELLKTVKNPYGDGGASEMALKILDTVSLDGILKKKFHDVQYQL